jgi:internalin A
MQDKTIERIEKALSEKARTLDLSGLGLRELPARFKDIAPMLEHLDLSKNDLSILPFEVGLCKNLQTVRVSDNPLRGFTALVGLKNLVEVGAERCGLTTFPLELLDCPTIQRLWLEGNQLATLPSGIKKLQNLEVLQVENNRLENLPEQIAEIPALKQLFVRENPLRTPPIEVTDQGIEAIRRYFEDLTRGQGPEVQRRYILAIALEHRGLDHTADVYNRPGAVKETEALRKVLEERYDFELSTTLYNEQVTKANITAALQVLVDQTTPTDTAIVYFNGYTGDARYESDFFMFGLEMLTFSEIASYFSAIRARHILFIVDNHLYGPLLTGMTRGMSLESNRFASRWALYRIGGDYGERFTPQLTKFLRETTIEFNVFQLKEILSGVAVSPIRITDDQGGLIEFLPKNTVAPQPPAAEPAAPQGGEVVDFSADFINDVKNYIAQGNLEQAFEVLHRNVGGTRMENELILLQSRYKNLLRESTMGTISFDEKSRTEAQITSTLLYLIDQIEKGDHQKKSTFSTSTSTANTQIIALIQSIETDRQNLLNEAIAVKRAEFENTIRQKIKQLEQLRAALNNSNAGPGAVGQNADAVLLEEDLWEKAKTEDTAEAFEIYLKNTPLAYYKDEANRRIQTLREREQEALMVDAIQKNPTYQDILYYLEVFPNGKHRTEIEALKTTLETYDDTLWQKTEAENTETAYQNFMLNARTNRYTGQARERIEHLKNQRGTNVREAKLILIGNGRVGKTSLADTLQGKAFNPKQDSTHGVRQLAWDIKLSDGQPLHLRIWDFGGQEIYHNTHRFFLSTRALYLLVWDKATRDGQTRKEDTANEENFNLDYWLDNIKNIGGEAPVLVVQNIFNEEEDYLKDPKALQDKYPFIAKFCSASPPEAKTLEPLRDLIAKQYKNAPKLKALIEYTIPDNWAKVRARLEALITEGTPYLKYDDYLALCTEHDMPEPNALDLSRFLTEIGLLLHFPDNKILREIVILQPRWATDLIYKVMNKEVKQNEGRFTMDDISKEWAATAVADTTFPDKARFRNDKELDIFLELMRAFDITFELRDQPGTYIAPQFLPEKSPNLPQLNQKTFRFGYEYPFWHRGIIARIIVRLGQYAEPGHYWRQGIRLRYEDADIHIQAEESHRRIRVDIAAPDPLNVEKYFLDKIFKDIHKNLNAEDVLFCTGKGCSGTLSRAQVEKLKTQNEATITCNACHNNIVINTLYQQQMSAAKKVFLSYSKADRNLLDQLSTQLTMMERNGKIQLWDDSDIAPGQQWDNAIKANLAAADVILLLVSADFLATNYIWDVEIAKAIERHDRGEAQVIPIILRPCDWTDAPFGKLNALPQKGKPITKFDDRDEAWLEVVQGIKKALL